MDKSQAQLNWELRCYGIEHEDMIAERPEGTDPFMFAIMILSDVQHVLAAGEYPPSKREEIARQWVNKAKFWVDYGRRELTKANDVAAAAAEIYKSLGR